MDGKASLIEQFCSITGAGNDVGTRLLEACGNNLELAVNMHMEGGGASPTPGTSSAVDPDHVRAPIPQTQELLVDDAPAYGFRGRKRAARSVFDGFRDFQAEAKQQEDELQGAAGSRRKKTKNLQDLFRPPIDITFKGTFSSARECGTSQGRWLMVNIQNVQEFACQALNRDVWSNAAVKAVIKEHFVFWQVYHDSVEGKKYKQFYKVDKWPYVGVVDPQTGENLVVWSNVDALTFCDLVTEFLAQHPTMESQSPPAKREDSIVDANEDAQMKAAITASMTDISHSSTSEITISDSDSDLETFSDSDDTPQPSPAKSRRRSNSDARSQKCGSSSPNRKVHTRNSPQRTESKNTKEAGSPNRKDKKSSPHKRESPLRTESSDGESRRKRPERKCSPKRTCQSPLTKSSSVRKSSPQRKQPLNNGSPKKSESIHNDVHPAVTENIRRSVDSDEGDKSVVCDGVQATGSVSSADGSDVVDSDRSMECVADTRDYRTFLGNVNDKETTLMLRLPDGQRDKLLIPESSKLMAVVLYVASKGYSNERYELVAHYPRRELSHCDFDGTLAQVGLHSQETIFVQKRT